MKIVVKLGGATLEDSTLLQRAVLAVKQLASEHQVAVVHGGAHVNRTVIVDGRAARGAIGHVPQSLDLDVRLEHLHHLGSP